MPDTLPTPTSWPSRTATLTPADRRLNAREATRLVDIMMGRADERTVVAHYLIIERDSLPPMDRGRTTLEIEQYRDPERVISQAADFETGDRRGKWVGAFTATYVDGKLNSIAMVEDLGAQVEAELGKRPEDRLGRLAGTRGCMKEIV